MRLYQMDTITVPSHNVKLILKIAILSSYHIILLHVGVIYF